MTPRHVRLLKRIAEGDCPRATYKEFEALQKLPGVGGELQLESALAADRKTAFSILGQSLSLAAILTLIVYLLPLN